MELQGCDSDSHLAGIFWYGVEICLEKSNLRVSNPGEDIPLIPERNTPGVPHNYKLKSQKRMLVTVTSLMVLPISKIPTRLIFSLHFTFDRFILFAVIIRLIKKNCCNFCYQTPSFQEVFISRLCNRLHNMTRVQ